jgi:hypothetical protein
MMVRSFIKLDFSWYHTAFSSEILAFDTGLKSLHQDKNPLTRSCPESFDVTLPVLFKKHIRFLSVKPLLITHVAPTQLLPAAATRVAFLLNVAHRSKHASKLVSRVPDGLRLGLAVEDAGERISELHLMVNLADDIDDV